MRVSDTSRIFSSLNYLNINDNSMQQILQKLSSNKNINSPDEDPGLAERIMALKNIQVSNSQYLKNSNDAKSMLSITETAADNVKDLLVKSQELLAQANDGALNTDSKEAICSQLDSIIKELVDTGNQSVNNKYIFGGTETTNKPFTINGNPPTSVIYNGNNSDIEYSVSENVDIKVSISGGSLFKNIINDVITARNNISSKNTTATSTTDVQNLDNDLGELLQNITSIGSKSNFIDFNIKRIKNNNIDIDIMRSGIEDLDMAQTITDLNLKENAYKTSLSVMGRYGQLNLADYLR